MRSKAESSTVLHLFCKQVDLPIRLVIDGHKAQNSNETRRLCSQVGTTLKILGIVTSWVNRA